MVTLFSEGPDGLVRHLSSEQMCFVQDLALDMAQFLLSAVGQDKGTEGALLLNECHIPLQECEKLDQSLALAFKHLLLPPDWSLLQDSNGKSHFRDKPGDPVHAWQPGETLHMVKLCTITSFLPLHRSATYESEK